MQKEIQTTYYRYVNDSDLILFFLDEWCIEVKKIFPTFTNAETTFECWCSDISEDVCFELPMLVGTDGLLFIEEEIFQMSLVQEHSIDLNLLLGIQKFFFTSLGMNFRLHKQIQPRTLDFTLEY